MLHFIVNPMSRSGKGRKIWDKIHHTLEKEKITYEVHFTKFHQHATKLASELTHLTTSTHLITIVVLGGDGTLNEVLNGLTKNENQNLKHITLGYIPTGSGNDFSRSMQFTKNSLKALEIILHPKEYTYIDYGIIENARSRRSFIVSSGIGYDASIAHDAFNSKIKKIFNTVKLGKLTYLIIGVKQLFLSKNMPAKLTIDSKIQLDIKKMLFTSIHVQKYEGGGFPFAPCADPTDGKLEVCVFHDCSKLRYAFLLLASIFEKHVHFKGVSIYSCKSLTLSLACESIVHTDGEDFGFNRAISARTSHNKIRFITS